MSVNDWVCVCVHVHVCVHVCLNPSPLLTSHTGFPERMSFPEFCRHYGALDELHVANTNTKDAVLQILMQQEVPSHTYKLGLSQVCPGQLYMYMQGIKVPPPIPSSFHSLPFLPSPLILFLSLPLTLPIIPSPSFLFFPPLSYITGLQQDITQTCLLEIHVNAFKRVYSFNQMCLQV